MHRPVDVGDVIRGFRRPLAEIERAIVAIADAQHGVVSGEQLTGGCEPVARHACTEGSTRSAARRSTGAAGAAVLRSEHRAVLSHQTAAFHARAGALPTGHVTATLTAVADRARATIPPAP